MFGNAFAAPMKYFGYVGSESEPTTLKNVQSIYELGKQRPPQAGGASFTAMIRP